MTFLSRKMQKSQIIKILRIHICTFGNKQFGDFLVTIESRKMQRKNGFSASTKTATTHAAS